MSGSHWSGPLLGSARAASGAFEGIPLGGKGIEALQYLSGDAAWRVWYEDFREPLANDVAGAALETIGYTETAVGTAAARSYVIAQGGTNPGMLVVNADTVADEGTNLQRNAAVDMAAATIVSPPHDVFGPFVGSATALDNRSLVFATRIGVAHTVAAWNNKFVIGIALTDTAMMTAATGALALADGGGLVFHAGENGNLNFVSQRGTTATTIDTSHDMGTPASATVIGGWIDLVFRADYRDASDANANGRVRAWVNGRQVADRNNVLPDGNDTLSFSLELINGPAAAQAVDMGIKYIFTALSEPRS